MSKIIAKKAYLNYTIVVGMDESPKNPRNGGALGDLACTQWKDRKHFGAWALDEIGFFDYYGDVAFGDKKEIIYTPIYTSGREGDIWAGDPKDIKKNNLWGVCFTTEEKAREWFSDYVSPAEEIRARALEALGGEIKILAQYLSEEIYKFEVIQTSGQVVISKGDYYNVRECVRDALDMARLRWLKGKGFEESLSSVG